MRAAAVIIPRGRYRPAVALVLAAALLAGCGGRLLAAVPSEEPSTSATVRLGARAPATEPPRSNARVAPSGLDPVKRFRSIRNQERTPRPTAVRIPTIGVRSSLERLGRGAEGVVEAPSQWHRAGWFAEGARPGQPGPAVILGHVDSKAGPAVFYRLRQLRRGDRVVVDRADGSTVAFVVKRVERHDKDAFPTRDVYFPTLEPTLWLLTCGGEFDREVGSYRDNIVVRATLAEGSSRPPASD